MVKKIEDLNFYELLEVSPTASSQEIHKAYDRVRRIYEPNSIALYSLFSPEETQVINKRIEEAYQTLVYESHRKRYDETLRELQRQQDGGLPPLPGDPLYRTPPVHPGIPTKPAPTAPERVRHQPPAPTVQAEPIELPPPPPFSGEFTGAALKLLREQRSLTIRQISETIKVGSRYLELIEEEQFPKLPARAYVRGFLTLYAKGLGYDPDKVSADYLKRYDAVMNPPKK